MRVEQSSTKTVARWLYRVAHTTPTDPCHAPPSSESFLLPTRYQEQLCWSEFIMGFISPEDAHISNAPSNGIEKAPQMNGNAFSSFDMTGLVADQKATPTGMKEEIVLLSWLMVLLRSREDSQISYDWSYTNDENDTTQQTINKLSMNEVMNGLGSNVGDVTTAILKSIPSGPSNAKSMILSTSTLSQTSETVKDEVRIPCIISVLHC